MNQLDYFKGLNLAITISAKDGEILYQNDNSIEVNGDARGRGLIEFSIILPDEMPHYDRG